MATTRANLIFLLTLQTTECLAQDQTNFQQQDYLLKKILLFTVIPVTVAFSFAVFVMYRSRRESFFKQRQTEFKLSVAELELKALRAQINPHFIFNCLNSIHHYMRNNDVNLASDYLVKFSQLVRYVLETSSFRMIPLTEDLDALRAYLELEQLRMQNAFQFNIQIDAREDQGQLFIPPMMIQPFVENSIWHGLNQKASGGILNIKLFLNDGVMICTIEDNGIRQSKLAGNTLNEYPSRKTSMGMLLINDRIKAINSIFKASAGFTIEDRTTLDVPAEGTRVILKLPYEKD